MKFQPQKPPSPLPEKTTQVLRASSLVNVAALRNQLLNINPAQFAQSPQQAKLHTETLDETLTRAESETRSAPTTGSPDFTAHNLIPKDFIFDESQLVALKVLGSKSHGCLMGAAGTGKTTITKAFVQSLVDSRNVNTVDLNYDKKLNASNEDDADDGQERKETPPHYVPSILLCGFTGRSVRQIKKNFPVSWHGNIMTIHRALRFKPEFYEDMDAESGRLVTKRRFTPWHTKQNKMPWEIIIVDESSMVALDLWDRFQEAMQPYTRVYMVGDINQLPPVHGKSIYGYAMNQWGTAELTHVHRQKGSQDQIIPNAHRILKGEMPQDGGNFRMMEISLNVDAAAQTVIKYIKALKERNQYNELFDATITAVNGHDITSPTAPLGQIPLNQPLAMYFNPQGEQIMVDCGRTRKLFSVGDKVMATKNDYETGVTNGMMGIITDIAQNGDYVGDRLTIGNWKQVQKHLEERAQVMNSESAYEEFEEMLRKKLANEDAQKKPQEKESFLRGVASHSITVDFSACETESYDDEGHNITFRSRGECESLMLAYVSTCHKMQGAECPFTIVICHEVFGRMLSREWLYTACTRASERVLLLYTKRGLLRALANQRVKGATIAEKVRAFQMLENNVPGLKIKNPTLQQARELTK